MSNIVDILESNNFATKKIIMFMLQIMIMINANMLGWTISHINQNKIIFTKKINELTYADDNLYMFLKNVIPRN